MEFVMLRSFDHAGYYETRLVLMCLVLGASCWFAARQRDYRYLVMFTSGAIFQAWMEYTLQSKAMRGAGYSLSVFGVTLSPILRQVFQGCVEGGTLSVMAYWFVALRSDVASRRTGRKPYLAFCALIVVLATLVGWLSRNQPISSPRPMFQADRMLMIAAFVACSLILCAWRGGLRQLGYFYAGLLIYIVLTFEPLHVLGARYVGVRTAAGTVEPASMTLQAIVMALSHLWEVAGGKVHYFAVPFALGLLRFRGGSDGSNADVPISRLQDSLS